MLVPRTIQIGMLGLVVLAATLNGVSVARAGETTTAVAARQHLNPVRSRGVDSGRPRQPDGPQATPAAAAGSPGPFISRGEILARAEAWLAVPVPYSQGAFRDGYRTDCSGFVSMVWKTNRNYWTGDLNTIGTPIGYNDLRPGDMLLFHNVADPVDDSHVVLFDHWVGAVGGDFSIYEQTPPHTLHRRWAQTGYSRSLFKPYRYINVAEGGGSLSGDGRAELVALDANGELRAFRNVEGMNFVWGDARVVGNGWMEPARTFFADLDGDGRDDLVALDANGELRAFRNVDGMNFVWDTPRIVGNGWTEPARTRFA